MLRKLFTLPPFIPLAASPDLQNCYQNHLNQHQLEYDAAQFALLPQLQTLLNNVLQAYHYQQQADVHKLSMVRPEKCRGLYLFGDVGRGKSMLMALLYEACPISQKRRVHFNTFMLEVHRFIHHQGIEKNTDALDTLAKNIRNSTVLLCFDEFHVTDIADAMILGRLFTKLFELGVIIIMTSNRHPKALYQGGSSLYKEQFLFFIHLLENNTDIVELIAQHDYRFHHAPAPHTSYYFPLNSHAKKSIQQHYAELTQHAPMHSGTLQLLGRHISLHAVHDTIALTSFAELCEQPLGSADYIKIASQFRVVLITDIPKLSEQQRNEAKRFVTLIDALYEYKVKLICSAEVRAQDLYTEGDGAFEFKRTVSRLIEMQSDSYLATKTFQVFKT